MKLYKFTAANGEPCNGGSGAWPLPRGKRPGKWRTIKGDLRPCSNGLHLCRPQDLLSWLNEELWEAEHQGEIVVADDKIVVRKARLLRRVDAWNDRTARLFAVHCAARVLPLFETTCPGDRRVRDSLLATRKFALGGATLGVLDAAEAAAMGAAGVAARVAAGDAAGDAARAAAGAAAGAAAWVAAMNAAGAAAGAAARVAARVAARDAARVAAGDAAWVAARVAAGDAARATGAAAMDAAGAARDAAMDAAGAAARAARDAARAARVAARKWQLTLLKRAFVNPKILERVPVTLKEPKS